jgi:hypothetical protein
MTHIVLSEKRDNFIDFLRSLAIIDMILVHYAVYFPDIIRKIIDYHDIAIEGFIFLSGYMVGRYYLQRYLASQNMTNKKILVRVMKILIIQYAMILSISLPHYIILYRYSESYSPFQFLIESLIFYNQIGLIHILPIFIPLFFISPLILYGLSRGHDLLILLVSLTLFLLGQMNPYFINYGEKAIFPVLLWQIYFIFGCWSGKQAFIEKLVAIKNKGSLLLVACVSLGLVMLFAHSNYISPLLTNFKITHAISIRRFPLNIYGLLYGSTLLFFLFLLMSQFWVFIRNSKVVQWCNMFGRNALLVFVIHVYFFKVIEILSRLWHVKDSIIYIAMLGNILFTYFVLFLYEDAREKHKPSWSKIVGWLFN